MLNNSHLFDITKQIKKYSENKNFCLCVGKLFCDITDEERVEAIKFYGERIKSGEDIKVIEQQINSIYALTNSPNDCGQQNSENVRKIKPNKDSRIIYDVKADSCGGIIVSYCENFDTIINEMRWETSLLKIREEKSIELIRLISGNFKCLIDMYDVDFNLDKTYEPIIVNSEIVKSDQCVDLIQHEKPITSPEVGYDMEYLLKALTRMPVSKYNSFTNDELTYLEFKNVGNNLIVNTEHISDSDDAKVVNDKISTRYAESLISACVAIVFFILINLFYNI